MKISTTTKQVRTGLGIGIIGLLIQWIADPSKFDGANKTFGLPFPPGILFVAGFGLLSFLTRRWRWHPIFAVLIAFWIVVGGALADKLQPNLTSSNVGTVLGNVVMVIGLAITFCTGLYGMVGRRSTKVAQDCEN